MSNSPQILVTSNGPYIVTGDIPLSVGSIEADSEGNSNEWSAPTAEPGKATIALCRCGRSAQAPYCDGTHARIGFDGTETAETAPYDSVKVVIDGPLVALEDVRSLCAVARFCDAGMDAWDGAGAASSDAEVAHLKHQVACCPSGRLRLRDKATGALIEPTLEHSITAVEDPAEGCSGPFWVKGGIALVSQSGTVYETRNRMTLCRCGASKNKPFCDGTHVEIKFQDGIQRQ